MPLELHIITNCVKTAPSTAFISRAWRSFCDTFGEITPVVWCDPNPHPDRFDDYARNIRAAGMPVVLRSTSLADATLKALERSTADYVFVLEHDWLFQRKNIHHPLDEITALMHRDGLYYLRFNQKLTKVRGWDKTLTQHSRGGIQYCLSNCWSGNPHILDRKKCLALDIPGRIRARGRRTLERKLTNDSDLSGAIYGPLNHPATIHHLDGRQDDPKPFWDQSKIRRHKKSIKEENRAPEIMESAAVTALPPAVPDIDLGIVVPACHLPDQAFLQRRFEASVKKDARPKITWEVLFVTPARFDVFTRHQGRDYFNISKAYNAGINYFKKRARFIACADIDLLFPSGFLDHSVRRAATKPHCGRVRLVEPDQITPRRWIDWKKLPPRPGTGAWNCMSYDDYCRIGGFNEEMFGWGGIDTDFKQRANETFGPNGTWYDDALPLMHVNHPARSVVAPRRPGENMAISNHYRKLKINWLDLENLTLSATA